MNGDGLGISWGVGFTVALVAILFADFKPKQTEPKWEYKYRAEVVRVVDGDTVDAEVDLGFDVRLSARFRLLGINAPEKNTEAGKKSLARLAELLPVGSSVVVQTTKDKKEKYGRYLGTFLLGGKSINQQLVDEGFAVKKGQKRLLRKSSSLAPSLWIPWA